MLARARSEGDTGRGRLRVYLGMAPGVGKTYAALQECQRRRAQGVDVVLGFVEHYGRPQTAAQIGQLEVVPRKRVPYGGATVEEMDTDAVLARRPRVVLVDELAHTNAPGSAREKRWQDVEAIRDAGIDVLSTMNVQHLESVADIVESITGAPVRERLPDAVLDGADEVELIDMSPHALRQRIQGGHVYPAGRAGAALESFFRAGNLTALRELALRRTAQQVDEQLQVYMVGHGIDASWPASERVLVCVDHQPLSKQLVRRAWRMASGLRAELLAAYVEPPDWEQLPFQVQKAVEANLRFAEDLGARVVRRSGRDVAASLAALAKEENVAQVVIGRSSHGRWHELFRGSVVTGLLRRVRTVDVHVIGDDTSHPDTP
ncbi:MAG TPA: universal stress protein [Chloroflexota bacterium]|nr:universal stress protein [Chloroflexota bacterium]